MTNQLPAHLQRYQSRDLGTALSQNLGSAAPPYVSIANGRFKLIDAAGNEQPVGTFDPKIGVYLDACIIDVNDHISRVYYASDFDPSAQAYSPPDCWSDNGVGPSVSCSNPQSSTCASCPQAVWGSAVSAQGKAIPACSMVQKIALLVVGVPGVVFLMRVPPNSHKHLRAYNELSRRSGINISDVVTRIYFDASQVGTLLFAATSYIDEPTAVAREQAYVEKKTDAIVGRTDVARPAGQITSVTLTNSGPGQPVQQIPQFSTAPAAGSQWQPQAGGFPLQQVAPVIQQNPASMQQMGSVMQQPAQQVQQPGPFGTSSVAPNAASPGPSMMNAAPTAATPSPSEQPAGRRRRRAASEPPAAAQGAPQQLQVPFPTDPHPAQQPQAQQPVFGMAQGQPVGANTEVQAALDGFFQGA